MKTVYCLLFMVVLTGLAYGQKASLKTRDYDGVRIKIVHSDANAEPVLSSIVSKMAKSFRDYKDVTVTNFEPDIVLYVSSLTIRFKSGEVIGHVLDITITEPLREYEMDKLAMTNNGVSKSLRDDYVNQEFYKDGLSMLLPAEDFDKSIQRVIESLDVKHIEPLRKMLQGAKEKGIKLAK